MSLQAHKAQLLRTRGSTAHGKKIASVIQKTRLCDGHSLGEPCSKPLPLCRQVKAVEIHDLSPGSHKVIDESLLRVITGIILRQRAQF